MTRPLDPPIPCPVGACGDLVPALFHSSCVQRAAWSDLERARFDREDRESEAIEVAYSRAAPVPVESAWREDEIVALEALRATPARRPRRAGPAEVAAAVLARRVA